jgi:hypothetical protein
VLGERLVVVVTSLGVVVFQPSRSHQIVATEEKFVSWRVYIYAYARVRVVFYLWGTRRARLDVIENKRQRSWR